MCQRPNNAFYHQRKSSVRPRPARGHSTLLNKVNFHFPLPSASQKDARASNMGKRAKVRDARPAHAEPAHRLTPPMSCCPQNQKEGLRKPKSGNSKPPDGLQGVAMAKGKSLPHSHSNPAHAGSSHLLTCLYTWQRGGQSNVRSWLRSWIRREAASRALRVPARERMRRRSCLRIKSRARVEQRVAGRRPTNHPGGASEVQAYLELRVYRATCRHVTHVLLYL